MTVEAVTDHRAGGIRTPVLAPSGDAGTCAISAKMANRV